MRESIEKWETPASTNSSWGPTGAMYPHEFVAEAVELFGDEVIPQFDNDSEVRATRFRREAAADRLGLS